MSMNRQGQKILSFVFDHSSHKNWLHDLGQRATKFLQAWSNVPFEFSQPDGQTMWHRAQVSSGFVSSLAVFISASVKQVLGASSCLSGASKRPLSNFFSESAFCFIAIAGKNTASRRTKETAVDVPVIILYVYDFDLPSISQLLLQWWLNNVSPC